MIIAVGELGNKGALKNRKTDPFQRSTALLVIQHSRPLSMVKDVHVHVYSGENCSVMTAGNIIIVLKPNEEARPELPRRNEHEELELTGSRHNIGAFHEDERPKLERGVIFKYTLSSGRKR